MSDPAHEPAPPTGTPYPWPQGVTSAFLFSCDVDVESPLVWRRGGAPSVGLGELEQRRFGVRQGLARLLKLLASYEIPGSFFVPSADAQRHPEVLPNLVDAGHEVGVHGHEHERSDALDRAQNAEILARSLEVFERQVGLRPRGYRSPAWEMTADLHALLRSEGFAYDSSLMGYDHPYSLDGLPEIPVEWLTDDAIYFRFRGGGLEHWPPVAPGVVLTSWLEEWRGVHAHGGLFTLTVHPWISGRAQRIRLLEAFLDEVVATPGVWITTAGALAAHHTSSAAARQFDMPLGPLSATDLPSARQEA